jgi:hypothetical protein
MKLLHVHVAQASQLIQNTLSRIVDAFVLFNNIARKGEPVFKWLLVPFNQQYFKFSGFKTEYYTVD